MALIRVHGKLEAGLQAMRDLEHVDGVNDDALFPPTYADHMLDVPVSSPRRPLSAPSRRRTSTTTGSNRDIRTVMEEHQRSCKSPRRRCMQKAAVRWRALLPRHKSRAGGVGSP